MLRKRKLWFNIGRDLRARASTIWESDKLSFFPLYRQHITHSLIINSCVHSPMCMWVWICVRNSNWIKNWTEISKVHQFSVLRVFHCVKYFTYSEKWNQLNYRHLCNYFDGFEISEFLSLIKCFYSGSHIDWMFSGTIVWITFRISFEMSKHIKNENTAQFCVKIDNL